MIIYLNFILLILKLKFKKIIIFNIIINTNIVVYIYKLKNIQRNKYKKNELVSE
jgi:hypothetical protein